MSGLPYCLDLVSQTFENSIFFTVHAVAAATLIILTALQNDSQNNLTVKGSFCQSVNKVCIEVISVALLFGSA